MKPLWSAATLLAVLIIATPGLAQREAGGGASGVRALVKSIDVKAGTITVTSGGGRETAATETAYSLTKNVEVCVAAGGGFRAGGLFKEVKITDLAPGLSVGLILTHDKKTV